MDLLLLLGDNAYLEGTDAQWQGAFFEIYPQTRGRRGSDDSSVYTVAGSSGKADELDPCPVDPDTGQEPYLGCTRSDWLQHPAHFLSLPIKGSVVVDASEHSLTSRFIGVDGNVLDYFAITRGDEEHEEEHEEEEDGD